MSGSRGVLEPMNHEKMPQLSSALSAPAMDEQAHPAASAMVSKDGKHTPLLPLGEAHGSASTAATVFAVG